MANTNRLANDIGYLKTIAIAYHRNGVAGNGFHVVLFTWGRGKAARQMVATVFEEQGNIAVLDTMETATGNIAFAMGNSWRGDDFEPFVREAIAAVQHG